jgi:O-antigen/teichoic acid export membrane protein
MRVDSHRTAPYSSYRTRSMRIDEALQDSSPPSMPSEPSRRSSSPPSSSAHPDRIHAHEIGLAVRNGIKLGGSLLLTWSVALIVKFQIPAHLGPTRVGHFGFAESFAAMFIGFVSLGIDTYVVKEISVRPKHASDFIGGVFALRVVMSIVLFAAMMLSLKLTGRMGEIPLTVAVFAVTQFFMSLNQTLAAILQATSKVDRLAISNVGGKVVWGVGLLLALHYNAPLYVLALPMLVGELLRISILIPTARIAAGVHYRLTTKGLWPVLMASLPYFIGSIALTFGNNLSMSALEFIRKDEREVGWYAASQNLGSLAMLLCPLLVWVVMPMLSRAWSRSPDEMITIVRRSFEALFVIIAPATMLISCGSDIFVRVAFGEKFAPAANGLSILSLVFLMFYLNIMLGNALVIIGKEWWNTLISVCSIFSMALLMLVCVPLGRRLLGTGGECAGAAAAVVGNEMLVVGAMLTRFDSPPLDRRNVVVILKSLAIAAVVLVTNHYIHGLGPVRLVIDLALYVALALVVKVVQPSDVRKIIEVVKARRRGKQEPVSQPA